MAGREAPPRISPATALYGGLKLRDLATATPQARSQGAGESRHTGATTIARTFGAVVVLTHRPPPAGRRALSQALVYCCGCFRVSRGGVVRDETSAKGCHIGRCGRSFERVLCGGTGGSGLSSAGTDGSGPDCSGAGGGACAARACEGLRRCPDERCPYQGVRGSPAGCDRRIGHTESCIGRRYLQPAASRPGQPAPLPDGGRRHGRHGRDRHLVIGPVSVHERHCLPGE